MTKYDSAVLSEHYNDSSKVDIIFAAGENELTVTVNKRYSKVFLTLKSHMHTVTKNTVYCAMPLSIWTDNFHSYYLQGE